MESIDEDREGIDIGADDGMTCAEGMKTVPPPSSPTGFSPVLQSYISQLGQ